MSEPKKVHRPLHDALLLSQLERHLVDPDPRSARLRCCVAQLKDRLLEEAGLLALPTSPLHRAHPPLA